MNDLAKHDRARKAEQAFAVHSAMHKAMAADPSLRKNPLWNELRQRAYQEFTVAFEAGQ